jgi:AraC-like DNA-binding protein
MEEVIPNLSRRINPHDLQINRSNLQCRVFWARIVSSESESLLTQYTKHTFYELQYALEGYIAMTLGDNQSLYIAESNFAVIPPDTYHQVVGSDSHGARFIMAFALESTDDPLRRALRCLEQPLPYPASTAMQHLLLLLLEKDAVSATLRHVSLTALLEAFLMELLETATVHNKRNTPVLPTPRRRVDAILSEIRKQRGIGMHVSELAAKFHLSERHLCRLFLSELGKSPKEAINDEKRKAIEEYITRTDLSLYEIAELCGFCDEYAMNKFFKRYSKTTLSEFSRIAKRK